MNLFQKICTVSLVSFMGFSWVHARDTLFILPSKSLNTEAHSIVAKIDNPIGKKWAISRIKYLSENLANAKNLTQNRIDAKKYREEIWNDIKNIITNLKNNIYSFDIPDSVRTSIEWDVLSYQKTFVDAIKKYTVDRLLTGVREIWTMHFTYKSQNNNMDIQVDPYKITVSQDRKNIELDTKITILATSSGTEIVNIMLDGNMVMIWDDFYITLRNYDIKISKNLAYLGVYEDTLKELKWKTYHQKINNEFIQAFSKSQENTTKMIQEINKVLNLLSKESLLTPVAQEGSSTILMFKKETIDSIMKIINTDPGLSNIDIASLMIPVDIRTDGKQIQLSAYHNANIRGTLSHDTDGVVLFTLNITDRGRTDPTTITLTKTPDYLTLTGISNGYSINSKTTTKNTTATITQGEKIIATAKIDNTGINAWMYDISATWEDTMHSWHDDEDNEKETIVVRFWWAVRQEFAGFIIAPPSISEEFEKTQIGSKYTKELRDTQRKNNLRKISTAIEEYYADNDEYPIPNNGCLDMEDIKEYIWDTLENTSVILPTDICKSGYYYGFILSDNQKMPVLASRMELMDNANYNNTLKKISQIRRWNQLDSFLYKTNDESNQESWLYVISSY